MTKEELEKATGQELIEQRDYCGVDGYYGDYLDNVNAEMLKRFNHLAELDKENAELKDYNKKLLQSDIDKQNKIVLLSKKVNDLQKENVELRKVAEFQQSSNMSRHFENKKLKEGLAIGSTFNKALNSMNKNLEEERDKYRNMVFDKDEQLTKAKEIIKKFLLWENDWHDKTESKYELLKQAEQFLKDCKVEK